MTKLKLNRPLSFIDVETTGLNTQEDRILDICVTKIHPDGKQETLKSLINPGIQIPIESTQIHGITDDYVKGKPSFKEFGSQLAEFIENCDLAGFGIIKFDLLILESEFKRNEIKYSREGRQIVDVQNIYHKLEPRDLSAAHLKYCGKLFENAHKAHADVKATIDVLESQLEKHKTLPCDISGLIEFSSPKDPAWIDDDGKIVWFRGEATLNFGQHKGKSLKFMYKNEMSYMQWILSKDFSSEVKDIIGDVLEGKFPEPVIK